MLLYNHQYLQQKYYIGITMCLFIGGYSAGGSMGLVRISDVHSVVDCSQVMNLLGERKFY